MTITKIKRKRAVRPMQEFTGLRVLRLPAVEQVTGLRASSIYEGMDAGTFPKSVPIGERSVGWLKSEIQNWIKGRIAARDKRQVA